MLLRIAITAGLFGALLTAAEHHGTVKSLGFPIPGATVTATQGETKITSFTDDSGAYAFPALGPGAWTIEVEMMGFSGATPNGGRGCNGTQHRYEGGYRRSKANGSGGCEEAGSG